MLLPLLLPACLVEGLDGDGDGIFGETCQPHFDDERPCESACDASNVVFIDGDRYCTTTCDDLNRCPSGHVCARFAPGDIPDSACLPPCATGGDCPSGFLGLCSREGVCGL